MRKRLGKNMKRMFLFQLFILFMLIILTGCNDRFSSNEMLESMQRRYPNDELIILSEETITISTDINHKNHTQGTKWHLKSNTNNFEFDVQEYQGDNTTFSINSLRDNYFDLYYIDFINKLYDSRIKLETFFRDDPYGIKEVFSTDLYLSDYNYTKSEIADAIVSLANKMKADKKLMELIPDFFYINIKDNNKCLVSLDMNEAVNKDFIIEELENTLEKFKDPFYDYTPSGVIK